MQAMLTEARSRRYRAVYLLKQSHMHRQDVRDHLQTRDRILVVEQETSELLGAAFGWVQAEGGVEVWTTLHGDLERIG